MRRDADPDQTAFAYEAMPLHRGRTTIVVDTELHDDAGRLVARVTQTQAVFGAR